MATLKELEERVENLELRLYEDESDRSSDGIDFDPTRQKKSWLWSVEDAHLATNNLEKAFDWEECPHRPADFERWYDLYRWLHDLEEE